MTIHAAHPSTTPSAGTLEGLLHRERLDAKILRSFGERRSHRTFRTTAPPRIWDALEDDVCRAATVLWELADAPASVCDDLLAYCAFLARELEITESLDLDLDGEWERLQDVAPRALVALDAIKDRIVAGDGLSAKDVESLAEVFGCIRAELATAARALAA